MKSLTVRQKQLLELIAKHIEEKGYPPSYQELAKKMNIRSKYAVLKHIDALVQKGYLEKDSLARGLRIIAPHYQVQPSPNVEIPLIGQVAAGFPILSEQNVERYVPVPRALIKEEGRYFAVKVQGDSMVGAGIYENDLLVVNSTNRAKNRDIVVALVGDEVTVKRLITRRGHHYLKAENPDYPDIHPKQEWSIQGKVVGLIREIH
ncbi:transcriptional repressor LexA [Caldithrix abyssi]|uniref:LexA repressor n=1 Tax=Caldithrix abyssi DSM 13497 TaxID=880073 RepID=H1XUB4_CALAY|nr:transcriptional repressor LexA [Caldithrix abyssi]APF17507.1 lexA SOS-response transcriptional repressor, LexA [Caldithrix abyssi DSM 13497]EHO41604.1 SOS-response transcriptional repressor, LexA [Caldithrix abyssi DSM 13497]